MPKAFGANARHPTAGPVGPAGPVHLRRCQRGARRWARHLVRPVVVMALGAGASLALVTPAQAAPSPLYVSAASGHDTGSCSTSATSCATIGYALGQAAPGATIFVAAGTYPEQLTVTQNVSIVGRAQGRVILKPAAVVQNDVGTDGAVPQYAIIDIHNASQDLNDVNLENLVINGSTAGASSFNSCADNFPGVYYHDAGGLMRDDTVIDMEMPQDLFGCQTGKGVGVLVGTDGGHTSSVTMARVTVTQFQKNGLECIDPGTTCVIERSSVTGIGPTTLTAQNGVEIWGVGLFDFTNNKVSHDTYSGPSGPAQATGLLILNAGSVNVRSNKISANDIDIYAGQAAAYTPVATAATWMIDGNRLTGATDDAPAPWSAEGEGYGDGLALDSTTNDVVVEHNKAGTNFEYGIALYGVTGATIRQNGTHRDYDGIYVGGPGSVTAASSGNTIHSNRAFYNTNDGILADVSSAESGNTFLSNKLQYNGGLEAQDRSTGSGTAGTGNSWVHNHCSRPSSASPTGIC